MADYTENLNLRKVSLSDDGTQTFNVDTFLNGNWEELDEFAGKTITMDKLVNNLAATESGFGLDARQGKAIGDRLNIAEGTLEDHTAQLSDLANNISNNAVLTQSVDYGMNSKITNDGATDIQPKFTIQGKTLINLLGKDGNCEDVSKWLDYQTSHALDTTNKVFGNNAIKITLTSTAGSVYAKVPAVDVTRYYCFSGYVKNGNATSIYLAKDNGGGGTTKVGTAITITTGFTRVFIKLQPSDLNIANNFDISVNGLSGQYAYVDGIMLEEITQAQYNDSNFTPSPYVDSYTCLQNPYIEVRHDNLVRNGNGEEGVAWWTPQNSPLVSISNGYLMLNDTDTNSIGSIYQIISVKSNTNYTYSVNSKCGTSPHARVTIVAYDNYGNGINVVNVVTTSITDTTLTGTFTIPSGYTKVYFYLLTGADIGVGASETGTVYFKQVMLVEGTTVPTQYLPCRVERVVLETKLTSDDSITYENGEVTGLINWKHKTLYGKDYDIQFHGDSTGYKTVKTVFPSIQLFNIANNLLGCGTKYDGSILKVLNSSSDGVNGIFSNDDTSNSNLRTLFFTVADSDTGWAETVNPNADEVKVFMNGWKALYNNGTRYDSWISLIDLTPAQGHLYTTVASTGSGTVVPLTSANGFAVGDLVIIYNPTTGTPKGTSAITNISGNNITISSTGWSAGDYVVKRDTNVVNYCKNNVAPGYEGYQLHYKLANPEPITDDNCHIHGDIPKFDVGDNYLFLDSGGVLGELANPSNDGGYSINLYNAPNLSNSNFKYRNESILAIYRNGVNNTSSWQQFLDLATYTYGRVRAGNTVDFDTSATYTVDYKILVTQAPQIGSIGCSYSQDISTAINDLQEEINNRQEHDSILDEIVDLSMYEKQIFTNLYMTGSWIYNGASLWTTFFISFMPKKAIPVITISNLIIYCTYTGANVDITNKFNYVIASLYGNMIKLNCVTSDASTITNIKNYGVEIGQVTITADCRGRI